ncbi:MAG: outer membrane lipoprotein-sorting protein [Chromatiaceae bacterium]|nr:outer membrane lipoprotein-sorting protein [Chromatiaceae bacterium]
MHLPHNMLYALLAGLLCAGSVGADQAETAGRALAQAVYDAPNGDDFASRAMMTLVEKGRAPREREMYTLAIDKGPGERWSLTRFTSPADIQGVGLLTKDYPGDNNDQWLYLPALDRVRRVSSARKGGRFVGSDLFFEDLRDREVSMDRHRLVGEEHLGKLLCKVLVSEPVDPDNSVYTKRVSWVHPQTLLVLRAELYQAHSDKPIKRLTAKRIKRIQGYWTVMESQVEDLESGHVTRISQSAVKYDQKIPDRLFSSQSLSNDSAEIPYRP